MAQDLQIWENEADPSPAQAMAREQGVERICVMLWSVGFGQLL
jgi:hypothetical protein